MREYGFAIPGFVYYDVRDEVTVRHGREFGHYMEPHQGIESTEDHQPRCHHLGVGRFRIPN